MDGEDDGRAALSQPESAATVCNRHRSSYTGTYTLHKYSSTGLSRRRTHCRRMPMTALAVLASRPVVGSSRNKTDCDTISSMPMFVRFRSPPDTPRINSVPTCMKISSSRETRHVCITSQFGNHSRHYINQSASKTQNRTSN